jgi:hypothetical protein
MFLLLLCLGTILAPTFPVSCQLSCSLPAELLSALLVWVRRGGLVPPLQPLYNGPYAVMRHSPRSFTIRDGSQDEVVTVSRLKACMATPGSPRRRSRPPGSRPSSLAATKRISFSNQLVSSPSSSLAPPRDGPGCESLECEEIFQNLK